MIRIGYAPGAFDLFHVGHLNLLREAKLRCDFLIAGVVSDEVLTMHKGVTTVVPLSERLEIVRNVRFVDAAQPAMTNDKIEIWRDLRFKVMFKGDDWRGTDKGDPPGTGFRRRRRGRRLLPIHALDVEQQAAAHAAQHRRDGSRFVAEHSGRNPRLPATHAG
jgi:cytidyltransferase-like protein